MYTVLTTCPDYGSRNVGDRLIEKRLKDLVIQEKGPQEFLTIFREDPLEPMLDQINASRALLMPAFPIRDTPMYPGTYRLVNDLSQIQVPMIPVGANWNVYPGDAQSRHELQYSSQTLDFLHYVADQVEQFSCRENFVCHVLQKHGIHNTLMTGDPAWFNLTSIGKPMRRLCQIESLVFTPPLSPYYSEQAERVMTMLADRFPSAIRFCAMHLDDADTSPDIRQSENSAAMSFEVTLKNRRIRELAKRLGFEMLQMSGNLDAMTDYYDACDLHVGYECHAHLYLLSVRTPSILIAEDARGVGFNHTLGVGGVTGFTRTSQATLPERKTHTSGYCTSQQELTLAAPREDVDVEIRLLLDKDLGQHFQSYENLAPWLDEIYHQVMCPFIQSLP